MGIVMGLVFVACSGGGGFSDSAAEPGAPGGEGTVADRDTGAFSQPAANLSDGLAADDPRLLLLFVKSL